MRRYAALAVLLSLLPLLWAGTMRSGGLDPSPGSAGAAWGNESASEALAASASLDPPRPAVATHHWMALRAMKLDDSAGALHHLDHISELVSGDHLLAMSRAVAAIREGELHRAEHVIEEMLAGVAEPDLSVESMHFQLALFSMEIDDQADARHHLLHAVESENGPALLGAAGAIEELGAGRTERASELVRSLVATAIDEDLARIPCTARSGSRARLSEGELTVVLVVDPQWASARDGNPAEESAAVLARATNVFEDAGLSLRLEESTLWRSPEVSSLDEMGHALDSAFESRTPEDLLVLLTGRAIPGGQDGYYTASGRLVVVNRSLSDRSGELQVLVHEIGHHLGLAHRSGTYMQPHGLPLTAGWSGCQQQALGRLAAA